MRLIDADALMDLVQKTHCTGCNNYNKVKCRACGIGDMLDYLDDAPTVDQWHYPSKGEYPKTGKKVLCKLEGFPDDEYRVGFYGRYKLWYLAGDIEKNVERWQYIVPPKEKA